MIKIPNSTTAYNITKYSWKIFAAYS